jgi:hypothetical protein
MAETTTTAHEPEQLTERWKCKACAEPWDLLQGANTQRCPECGGPLRLVPGPSAIYQDLADRALVASVDDQQRPVAPSPGDSTPWSVLKRLEAIGGSPATDERDEDTGQQVGAILIAFLAGQHERTPIRVEHTAAD